jgi:hypothetical protein
MRAGWMQLTHHCYDVDTIVGIVKTRGKLHGNVGEQKGWEEEQHFMRWCFNPWAFKRIANDFPSFKESCDLNMNREERKWTNSSGTWTWELKAAMNEYSIKKQREWND